MKIAVAGATGFIGHHAVAHLLASGHEVTALGRRLSLHAAAGFFALRTSTARRRILGGQDVLVHAALSHVPAATAAERGRKRPRISSTATSKERSASSKPPGTRGVPRILFLSSRAVYGDYPPGTALHENLPTRPDTLYGEVKVRAEEALACLAASGLTVASLRATGVYGPPVPGLKHKWARLLDDFAHGRLILPRAATEVHSDDLAEAIRILAVAEPGALSPMVFNVSDFVLDQRDLLAQYANLAGLETPLPARADIHAVSMMRTDRLRRLGWRPSGPSRLRETLEAFGQAR